MSHFIRHEPCPQCGSRDNLGVWDDHVYCFGCKYYRDDRSLEAVVMELNSGVSSRRGVETPEASGSHFGIELPERNGDWKSSKGYLWLKRYGLTPQEISKYGIYYASDREHLIFPVRDAEGVPVFYLARNFSGDGPKTINYPKGHQPPHDVRYSKPTKGPTVVCVEDVVSSIKVARAIDSCCLYGSAISKQTAKYLAKEYDNLVIWLDLDKTSDALKYSKRYSHLFKKTDVIVSDLDPKEYSTQEIKEYVKEWL